MYRLVQVVLDRSEKEQIRLRAVESLGTYKNNMEALHKLQMIARDKKEPDALRMTALRLLGRE